MHLAHILFAGEHKFMVDDPVRLPLEECGAGVNEDRGLLHDCLIPLLRVFAGCMEEEAAANRHPDLIVVGATGN